MKKLLSMLLVLCLAVAAAGCGGGDKKEAAGSGAAQEKVKVSLAMLRLCASDWSRARARPGWADSAALPSRRARAASSPGESRDAR